MKSNKNTIDKFVSYLSFDRVWVTGELGVDAVIHIVHQDYKIDLALTDEVYADRAILSKGRWHLDKHILKEVFKKACGGEKDVIEQEYKVTDTAIHNDSLWAPTGQLRYARKNGSKRWQLEMEMRKLLFTKGRQPVKWKEVPRVQLLDIDVPDL